MTLLANPYVRAFVGGLSAAVLVATPLVDDGILGSEILAIVGAFLSGSGLTAVSPSGSLADDYEGEHVAR